MKILKFLVIALMLITLNTAKAQTTAPIDKVLNGYLGIKNALANDDGKLANVKAKEFTEALKTINTANFDAKQKETWATYSEKLRFDGEHISESAKLEHQREHFVNLSKSIYNVLKAFKSNSAVVYMQYCPMKKESWLSETLIIKNPYLGKSMSDCGRTTETLKGLSK